MPRRQDLARAAVEVMAIQVLEHSIPGVVAGRRVSGGAAEVRRSGASVLDLAFIRITAAVVRAVPLLHGGGGRALRVVAVEIPDLLVGPLVAPGVARDRCQRRRGGRRIMTELAAEVGRRHRARAGRRRRRRRGRAIRGRRRWRRARRKMESGSDVKRRSHSRPPNGGLGQDDRHPVGGDAAPRRPCGNGLSLGSRTAETGQKGLGENGGGCQALLRLRRPGASTGAVEQASLEEPPPEPFSHAVARWLRAKGWPQAPTGAETSTPAPIRAPVARGVGAAYGGACRGSLRTSRHLGMSAG